MAEHIKKYSKTERKLLKSTHFMFRIMCYSQAVYSCPEEYCFIQTHSLCENRDDHTYSNTMYASNISLSYYFNDQYECEIICISHDFLYKLVQVRENDFLTEGKVFTLKLERLVIKSTTNPYKITLVVHEFIAASAITFLQRISTTLPLFCMSDKRIKLILNEN